MSARGPGRPGSPYLAVIPARGGSKRVPGKNLALLGGKPLLQYSIEAALGSKRVGRVLVSTDDPEIARAAVASGAEVPEMRPNELARDASPMLGVVRHAIAMAESEAAWVEAVVLLQPTSPFRTAVHVDAAIARYEVGSANTLVSVRAATEHPYYAWRTEHDRLIPFFSMQQMEVVRQDLPPALVETGAIFILNRKDLDAGRFYGDSIAAFEMDERASLDIDTPQDLEFARFLLAGPSVKAGS
jgi:CMP-N,N'-diacetyllegionaminic acid synthase